MQFKLESGFSPAGDQPKAIKGLMTGLKDNQKEQVLLGATGTGKTFIMANIIEQNKRPTIVLAHNKTLASQLYGELKEFFPNNRVEYFVSYFDYYQPEAYLPGNDIYIEKDSKINDEIERLRHSATASLFEGEDVIIVSSVSCIYGLGSPIDYNNMALSLREGQTIKQKDIIYKLIDLQYQRNDLDIKRSSFSVKGDVIEFVLPYHDKHSFKIEFWGDEIQSIKEIDIMSQKTVHKLKHVEVFPASHYVLNPDKVEGIVAEIKRDLDQEVAKFISEDKQLEAQRLKQRTEYDIEMIREVGYCSGIENYTRYFSGFAKGQTPYTLLDYFPENFLMIVDESHVTLSQVKAMYEGDRRRKQNLVDYGFRVKAAMDNRPLTFDEFNNKLDKIIYVSSTPAEYELSRVDHKVVEQVIRPTGLLDPTIEIRKKENQIDDIISEIKDVQKKGQKILITTLTKKMSEDLTDYLKEKKIKTAYLHSEIKTLQRVQIIQQLRSGKYDVLVGINLLREGLDIPEVSRVMILDADKAGFLRSRTSLIQIIGRASRNSDGKVVMYANEMTNAMIQAIDETDRRRNKQIKYNQDNNIVPTTIKKDIASFEMITDNIDLTKVNKKEKKLIVSELILERDRFAKAMNYEKAAEIRDLILELG